MLTWERRRQSDACCRFAYHGTTFAHYAAGRTFCKSMVPTSGIFIVTHEVLISASLFHFKHTCMLCQVYMYYNKMLLNTRGHYTFTCLYI